MRFYDTNNTHDSIVHHANFLVGTDTTSYPLADQARACNIWIGKILGWIWEAQGAAEFDDPNYTDFPEATTDLVNSQQDYTLPGATASSSVNTEAQLIGVSVKNVNALWHPLIQINWDDYRGIDRAELFKTDGLPIYYDWVGNSIFLYPNPDNGVQVTLSGGLKVFFTRSQDLLTASDTTQQPPFASFAHEAVAIGDAFEYASAKGMEIADELRVELYGGQKNGSVVDGWKKRIQTYYAQRNWDRGVRIVPNRSERRSYR